MRGAGLRVAALAFLVLAPQAAAAQEVDAATRASADALVANLNEVLSGPAYVLEEQADGNGDNHWFLTAMRVDPAGRHDLRIADGVPTLATVLAYTWTVGADEEGRTWFATREAAWQARGRQVVHPTAISVGTGNRDDVMLVYERRDGAWKLARFSDDVLWGYMMDKGIFEDGRAFADAVRMPSGG